MFKKVIRLTVSCLIGIFAWNTIACAEIQSSLVKSPIIETEVNDQNKAEIPLLTQYVQEIQQSHYLEALQVLKSISAQEETEKKTFIPSETLGELYGITYYHLGQFTNMAKYYQQLLVLQKQSLDTNDPRIAGTLRCLSFAYHQLGNLTEEKNNVVALKTILNDLVRQYPSPQKLTESKEPFPSLDAVEVRYSSTTLYRLLAMASSENEQYETTEQWLLLGLQQAKESHHNQTSFLLDLAGVKQNSGDSEKANEYYLAALKTVETEPQQDPISLAILYTSVGQHYFYQGDLDKAKALYIKAQAMQSLAHNSIQIVFLQTDYLIKRLNEIHLTPDYLADLKVNNVVENAPWFLTRWGDNAKVIQVYIESPQNLADWKPEYSELVKNAFSTWNAALNNRFEFAYNNNPKHYDIKVSWQDKADRVPFVLGLNTPTWAYDTSQQQRLGGNLNAVTSQHQIIMNDLVISLHDAEGVKHSQKMLFHVILHEVGHTFGLRNHSLYPGDVMYGGVPKGYEHPSLSERDKATIKTLYAMKPDFTNDSHQAVSDLFNFAKSLGYSPVPAIDY